MLYYSGPYAPNNTVQGQHMDHVEYGKTESSEREIVTKEKCCPMRRDEIGKKRNIMLEQCCSAVVQ